MCLSPHEMTSAQLENELEALKELLQDPKYATEGFAYSRQVWEGRIVGLEKLLKERAERGEY